MRSRRLQRGIRLFDHPVLDWGSRVHPAAPGLFWAPFAVAALIWGAGGSASTSSTVGWFIFGYALWIVTEYAIHRWFFHFRPRHVRLRRLFYYIHEHHHRYQERDRLLAPPLLSLSIAAVLCCLFYSTLGRLIGEHSFAVAAGGMMIGYLVYDYTHFVIHFTKPRTRWGRYLRRCHLEHHFHSPDRWFCISWPWLDYVFRTHGGRRDTELKGIELSCGVAQDVSTSLLRDWDAESLPPNVREYERQMESGKSVCAIRLDG